jgi:hypothetical protein
MDGALGSQCGVVRVTATRTVKSRALVQRTDRPTILRGRQANELARFYEGRVGCAICLFCNPLHIWSGDGNRTHTVKASDSLERMP